MKKLTAVIMAALFTLPMFACDKKKSDSEPLPEEITEEVTAEATTEPVYRELVNDDFHCLDLTVETSDEAPPTELHSSDLSGIDFGERLSPCKAEGVRENYGVYLDYYRALADGLTESEYLSSLEEMMQEEADICEKTAEGQMDKCTMLGDKFYIAVTYDDHCSCHDSSLFVFDPVTLEYEELERHTGLDYHGCYTDLCAANDKLYYYDCYNTVTNNQTGDSVEYSYDEVSDSFVTNIYCFDPETRETSEILTLDERIVSMYPMKNGIMVGLRVDTTSEDGRKHSQVLESRFYDYETGEELEQSDTVPIEDHAAGRGIYCDGEPVEITGGYNGNIAAPVTVKTQYYTIETDLTQWSHVFAWKERLCILNTEKVNDVGTREMSLYTYDLATMERTRMVINGYTNGDMQKGKDGIFMTQQSSEGWMKQFCYIYYLMPEYGTIYKLDKTDEILNVVRGEQMYYLTLEKDDEGKSGRGYGNYYYGKPKTLYWFDAKE